MGASLAILVIIFGLIGWLGQLIVAVNPVLGQRVGLIENENEVDGCFYQTEKGIAKGDVFTLWIFPAAGVLFLFQSDLWIPFMLLGAPIYFYLGISGIVIRISLKSAGIPIGSSKTLNTAYTFLSIWILLSVVSIFYALQALG